MFDPEKVHYFSMNSLKLLCKISFLKKIISRLFCPQSPPLQKEFLGISFKNPVGLGAGFDKNAQYLNELEALGFGFVEIGTVTPKPQAGNDKPRLFRLPKDKALINRMGFNNDGVEVVAERLRKWSIVNGKSSIVNSEWSLVNGQSSVQEPAAVDAQLPGSRNTARLIIGGNIGKNKITPNEEAWKDYEICFTALHPYVDYFVVNVSSPNTPGLRELQEKESLRKILTNLQALNLSIVNSELSIVQPNNLMSDSPLTIDHSPFTTHHSPLTIPPSRSKPILLKIAPDLTQEQIDDVIDLAMEIKLDGLVAANTTISRDGLVTTADEVKKMGAGGLSGLPVQKRSTAMIAYIYKKTNGQIPIIASGGIFSATDAKEKLKAGASLVQVWTGFVYEGPAIVKNICRGL